VADNPTFGGAHVIQNSFELPGIMGIGAAVGFDFHHDFLATSVKDQICLLTGGCAPKKELSERMRHSLSTHQILNHKSFPARSSNWVVMQVLQSRNVEQVVQKAGVPDKNPWRFYKAFADVAKISVLVEGVVVVIDGITASVVNLSSLPYAVPAELVAYALT
jgi:hypothetical protein